MKRIWIVGASQGIGRAVTEAVLAKGYCVIASSRCASSDLAELKTNYTEQLALVDLDVTNDAQTVFACEQAWQAFGGIDIWFYNVGIYEKVTQGDWQFDTFKQINSANYLGCVALMCELAPRFREQGAGRWVWNVSLASQFGLPFGSAYSAPKAALVNLAESLRPEFATQNIELGIINHGFVKTRLTDKNDFDMPWLMSPEACAERIVKCIECKHLRFETRFPRGLSWAFRVLRALPYRASLALTRKMVKK